MLQTTNPLQAPPLPVYNLNEGQVFAAEEFMQFLFNPNEKEFRIAGAAGVGKTYLMNYIIDNTMPRYHEMCQLLGIKPEFTEVVMTATTNKAADVLSRSVNRPTSTIHSFFNLTVYDDYTNGKTVIRRTNRFEIKKNTIIIIDEASLIDTDMWKTLHDSTLNCKLVYVGDRHQLPPVHEDLSPIYKQNSPMVELTQPVRNVGQPALMAICAQLRHTVDTGDFFPIHTAPGVIDLLDGNQMQQKILDTFQKQTDKARILVYTNHRAIEYNDHIRAIRNLPETYTVGEILVNNSVYHTRKETVPVEREFEVMRNQGHETLLIDEEHNVHLAINRLDLRSDFGTMLYDVPVPTDRDHFQKLIKYYNSVKDWPRRNHLKNDFGDLRPREAATVHKSQGSTYDTVFIDLGNISTCHQPKLAARLLYVAFSRARSQIYLYGDLAQKYGGLLT